MGLGSRLVPTGFKLEAVVTQVARNGNGINHHVVSDFVDGTSVSVAEEDVLQPMEAQQGVAKTLAGDDGTVFGVKVFQHFRVVHEAVELGLVQRPRVDVRVDAEVGGSTKEEGLA